MKPFLRKIWPWLRNKYVLTISLFAIWMLFFDQNNLVDRIKMSSEIRQLENDREYYMEQIQKDSTRLDELTTNKENLEKYAREQFLMKKPDEDVFLVIEDNTKNAKKEKKASKKK
jgi:cell division protein DivIC